MSNSISELRIALFDEKLEKKTVIPEYKSEHAGAFDLTATSKKFVDRYYDEKEGVHKGGYFEYGTNLVFEIPEGYMGVIAPRSSSRDIAQILSNSLGLIDSDYRGEVKASFRRDVSISEHYGSQYEEGDRVAQMFILPVIIVKKFKLVKKDELSKTERGEKGHGSTNKPKVTTTDEQQKQNALARESERGNELPAEEIGKKATTPAADIKEAAKTAAPAAETKDSKSKDGKAGS